MNNKKDKIKEISDTEKECRELYDLKIKLHEMLKELIVKGTALGEIEESYAEEINFDISEDSIYSCAYYGQLTYINSKGEEFELDNDLNGVRKLYNEIEKRGNEFKEKIKKTKISTAEKVFEKPLSKLFNKN